jgi:hypothetical protein
VAEGTCRSIGLCEPKFAAFVSEQNSEPSGAGRARFAQLPTLTTHSCGRFYLPAALPQVLALQRWLRSGAKWVMLVDADALFAADLTTPLEPLLATVPDSAHFVFTAGKSPSSGGRWTPAVQPHLRTWAGPAPAFWSVCGDRWSVQLPLRMVACPRC